MDITGEIIKVLDELTQRLSGPAAQVWGVLMKQVIIEGWLRLAMNVIMLSVVVTFVYWLPRLIKKLSECDYPDEEKYITTFIVGGILSVIFVIFICFSLPSALEKILNPSYHAIMRLTTFIK